MLKLVNIYTQVKLFPRIMEQCIPSYNTTASFFRMDSIKSSTMRMVLFTEFGIECSYTIETSMAGYDGKHYTEPDLQRLGRDIGHCIVSWSPSVSESVLLDAAPPHTTSHEARPSLRSDLSTRIENETYRSVREDVLQEILKWKQVTDANGVPFFGRNIELSQILSTSAFDEIQVSRSSWTYNKSNNTNDSEEDASDDDLFHGNQSSGELEPDTEVPATRVSSAGMQKPPRRPKESRIRRLSVPLDGSIPHDGLTSREQIFYNSGDEISDGPLSTNRDADYPVSVSPHLLNSVDICDVSPSEKVTQAPSHKKTSNSCSKDSRRDAAAPPVRRLGRPPKASFSGRLAGEHSTTREKRNGDISMASAFREMKNMSSLFSAPVLLESSEEGAPVKRLSRVTETGEKKTTIIPKIFDLIEAVPVSACIQTARSNNDIMPRMSVPRQRSVVKVSATVTPDLCINESATQSTKISINNNGGHGILKKY